MVTYEPPQLQAQGLTIGFSPQQGALDRLTGRGVRNVVLRPSAAGDIDAHLASHGWLAEQRPPSLRSWERSGESISLVLDLGPLAIRETFHIHGGRIRRTIEIENRSEEEQQLLGVRLDVSGVTLEEPEGWTFEAPATCVRPRTPVAIAGAQSRQGSPHPRFAPAARHNWERAMDDAPDVSPGLMAAHNPYREETLLVWYFSEVEAATPQVFGAGQGLTLGHELGLAGWLPPGARLTAGAQYLQLIQGPWEAALQAFQDSYVDVGVEPPICGVAPAWVRSAAVYEVHPGMFGGFRGLAGELPRIARMGFNVLYLMPVMTFDNRSGFVWDENWIGSGSPYAMKDFEAFESTLGSEADFLALVHAAHAAGMKVLMDFVAQGCARDARYVVEHPEWFCRDERGELVSSHGWNDTYSLDWANPSYQAYMVAWAKRFVRDYDIDGYRVDAPHGKEPNWDRSLTYHASATNLGVLGMLESLQRSIREVKPETALLCELFGPVFVKSHQLQCDYLPYVNLIEFVGGQLSAEEFGLWLRDYWSVMPPSARRVCFTETHDTRTDYPAYGWRGSAVERAMFAILILAGFIPMMWSGQERGLESFYQDVLHARAASPALREGERLFAGIGCENPRVISILATAPGETVWGVVSLHAERTPLRFTLPAGSALPPAGPFHLVDLITREGWSEYGTTSWALDSHAPIQLSLHPFRPYFFRFEWPE